MARRITEATVQSPTRLAREVDRHPGRVAVSAARLADEADQARRSLDDRDASPTVLAQRLAWLARIADQGHRVAAALTSAGRCARCGITLTDPVSVRRGVGPDCYKALGSHYLDVVTRDTDSAVGAWADIERRAALALEKLDAHQAVSA